ncbi:MAG TPA: hypothetical protein DCW68_03795 [Rhodospirillaceae bacterium]|nr:hypothetical protein [Rhodospirillaceae bacterium]
MYVFSSKRPTIAEPVIEPRSTCVYRNQTQDIAQANRYEAELKNFVTLHKLPAFAAILAENAGQLETLASECDPALPELMPEIRKFQSFWQSRKIRMPENSYHTCQAAKHAGPELLHTLLTALPKHEERMEAVRCLAPYMSIMEEILRAKAQTQANKAIILRTKTDQACKTTTRQLEPFRQRLKEIPGTIIGHETLTALEKLAETHGAQAAINTLNTQPQSFDVHFVKTWQVGDLSVNLRPWNWIRTRFHADAWYPRLVDYRKDLARWQEQDPDKSFALLKHILEQKEEMGKTISPLNAQAMIAEEAHKVFESLSQEARRLVPQLMKIQFSLAEQPSTNHRRYTPILTPTQKPPG